MNVVKVGTWCRLSSWNDELENNPASIVEIIEIGNHGYRVRHTAGAIEWVLFSALRRSVRILREMDGVKIEPPEVDRETPPKRHFDAVAGKLGCEIANLWQRDRVHGAPSQALLRKLDEIEAATRGDDRRCVCLAKKSGHDIRCPAR